MRGNSREGQTPEAGPGLAITRVELIHLNKDYRHPGSGNLLTRTDVTVEVEAFLSQVPGLVATLTAVLAGPLPEKALGAHCYQPRDCAFQQRCWPDDPAHIRHLYRVGLGKTALSYMSAGVHSIWDIPKDKKLPDAARRQLKALKEERLVVEPTLVAQLEPFQSPLGYLDFETVARAVPV